MPNILEADSGVAEGRFAIVVSRYNESITGKLLRGAVDTLTEADGSVRLGLFYCNPDLARYDATRRVPARTAQEKLAFLEAEFDRHAV